MNSADFPPPIDATPTAGTTPIPFNPVPFNPSETSSEASAAPLPVPAESPELSQPPSEIPLNQTPLSQPPTIDPRLAALVESQLQTLLDRKQQLETEVTQLERRRDRIQAEMRGTFSGNSDEIAIRVQSFKEYLLGSLQDLVVAADRLELVRQVEVPAPTPAAAEASPNPSSGNGTFEISDLTFAEPNYQAKNDRIRKVIEVFQTTPDYYGPAWKLRRTFDRIPAERTADWFFNQGGRGAIKTLGSRLQNILVGSACISILYNLYGDRLRPLILANSPERLGEWRRGLQDCLGLTRNDFAGDRGPALFEFPEPLVQRAERAQQDGKLPLIIIDEMEEAVNLGVLQFPLWLAFAPAVPNYQAGNSYSIY
jgi:hypothetical protein